MTEDKRSILYVDDESVNLELFKSIFYRDYNVFIALSAVEGLEIIQANKIGIIITDEKMPFMNGVEFLEKVHEMHPEIPPHRLLTSGYSRPDSIEKAFNQYNLDRFIPKPWDIKELKQVIKEILD